MSVLTSHPPGPDKGPVPDPNTGPLLRLVQAGDGQDADAVASADAALVMDLRAQTPGATRAIWDRYQPLVRRVLSRSFGPNAEIDDLVQEAFIRLYRAAPKLEKAGSLRSLIFTITTRVTQQELRSRWIRRWVGLTPEGVIEDAAEDTDMEAREALSRFYEILDKLPTNQRQAFVLRNIEGLELTEVADALGTSLSTVKRWLVRATERVSTHASRDAALRKYLPSGDGDRDDE